LKQQEKSMLAMADELRQVTSLNVTALALHGVLLKI